MISDGLTMDLNFESKKSMILPEYRSYLHIGVFVDKFVELFCRRFVFPGQIVIVPLGRHQHMFLRFVLLTASLDQFLCTKIKHDNISNTRANSTPRIVPIENL